MLHWRDKQWLYATAGRCAVALVISASSWLPFKAEAQSLDIKDILRSELACALLDPVFAEMPAAPLFTSTENGCEAAVPDSSRREYYLDETCLDPINFVPTDLVEHCALLLDSTGLGEGVGISGDQWTLPPGTRFDLGARSLENVQQPYLQRTIYRRVDTSAGQCALEMRVYSARPGLQNQRPLIAFHGGSWSGRGFGFFGLELTIPHYIEKGFVVFAPFYRLLGDDEGSAACHNATISDIVSDANAALDWVKNEGSRFGVEGRPVTFGQSAGAHLAASLAIYRAEEISGAVLMYPPTDFTDFALRAMNGTYANEQGLGILRRVMQLDEDADINEIDLSASPVPENSFPARIIEDGLRPAPMFMIHGLEDDLVEARQASRLCDALAGRELSPSDAAALAIDSLLETISCGDDSELQLIREGQHALDVCIADAVIPTDLCLSGSEASRLQVSNAIADASQFAIAIANQNASDSADRINDHVSTRESRGGSMSVFMLLILWLGISRNISWLISRRQSIDTAQLLERR